MDHDFSEEFLRLLGKNSRQIYACVFVMVLNKVDADDIIQETNLVLWKEFGRFERGTNFLAWAKRIATNQVLAWRTRRKRDRHVFGEEFLNVVARETNEYEDGLARRSEHLARCLEKLPEHGRTIIARRYDEQVGIEKLADEMNRSTDAVYKMLSRLRKTLHDCVTNLMAKEMT